MDPTSGLAAEPTPTESAAIDRANGRLVAGDGGGRAEPAAGTGRWIGPWGTTTRLVAGAAGVTWGLAVPHQHPLLDLPLAGSRPWGALAGIVVLPALTTVLMALRGRSAPPLRLGHGAACLVTGGVVVLVQVFPVAILTWIGSTLLVLAALGRGGCEVLAAPNLLLRRRDYLACLPFTPIDEWESRRAGRPAGSPTTGDTGAAARRHPGHGCFRSPSTPRWRSA